MQRLNVRARFLAKCERDGTCLLWRGAVQDMHKWRENERNPRYAGAACNWRGHFRMPTGREYAHRAAWRLWVGPIPTGLVVRHTCRNTLCVAVWHLRLGTPLDNAADRVRDAQHATSQESYDSA